MSQNKRFHRVWVDGCYDMTHFGHYNCLRQCAQLGDELYAGICRDDDIAANKAQPVFPANERFELISACRWVTKAIPDAPYTTDLNLLRKLGCDGCAHGDDPCIAPDGSDYYQAIKDAGIFTTVPRTKAISTTNLIGRMLRLPKDQLPDGVDISNIKKLTGDISALHTYIPTTHRIAQFSEHRDPTPEDKVIYVDGTFDLLHAGHASFLKKAKALGTYLVVGVHDDIVADEKRDTPIMTLQERVLNVLAMKYVDDVIIGAPYIITKALIDQVNPALVVEGSAATRRREIDAFKIPKELGIYKHIESDYPELTSKTVIARIFEHYQEYEKRNASKEKASYEQV